MGVVKNGCDHPGKRTSKLAISHKGISGITDFLNGDSNLG